MISERISFILSLCCCIAAGAVMVICRVLAWPLWLVITIFLLLLAGLGVAAFRLYAGAGRYQEHEPELAPRTEFPLILAALCFLLAGLFRLPVLLSDAMLASLLQVVVPLLAAAACGLRFLRGERHPSSGPLALLPIFSLCIQLLLFYRSNSNHPQLGTFGYEVIVLSLLLLGLYITASSKYKYRHPVFQRFWAMLPLSAAAMEYALLIISPSLLQQTSDMGNATLLTMAGACALLITPLLRPAHPVALPQRSDDWEADSIPAAEDTADTDVTVDGTYPEDTAADIPEA